MTNKYYKLFREMYEANPARTFFSKLPMPAALSGYINKELKKIPQTAQKYMDSEPFLEEDWDNIKKIFELFESPLMKALS